MQVDPRGQRFGAALTAIVLIVVLVSSSWLLLAAQAVVFLVGVVFGLRNAPYGLIYQALIRPRHGVPRELEPEAPPRFAQGVGAAFALIGVFGYVVKVPALGMTATALALVAAVLNAAFGFCLGCEAYLLIRRLAPRRAAP
ncbi:DUF4395 domain-containing protein [Actinoallomurus sp. NPDC050550]|uniref:DUF4395 domain-containing protein n=1 Tax=Actinoallomurus sp. NPDC050550 TaxID=3154937 RepID=UPI0033FFFAC7